MDDPAICGLDNSEDEAPAQNQLQHAYAIWVYLPKFKNAGNSWLPMKLATFKTVQEFWKIYQFMLRPSQMEIGSQINIFWDGVEPTWEDETNKNGGRWQLKFNTHPNPNITNKIWEDLLLAVIGEQFYYANEITGLVVSLRKGKSIISIWNKHGKDQEIVT